VHHGYDAFGDEVQLVDAMGNAASYGYDTLGRLLTFEDEMSQVIFDADGLVVSKVSAKFYVKYDAGAHQIAMREDEISEEDARRVMAGPAEATKVLFELQDRLLRAGIDPYGSNVK
jgi:YD repeat-containing protein